MQQSSLVNPKPTKFRRGNPRNIQVMQPMMIQPRFARTTGGKRPVDKLIINVLKTAVDATDVSTTLTTATFPCTIVGLRWDLVITPGAGTSPGSYAWCVIILRDGVTVSSLAISDGATLYAPEQDVMVFARGSTSISAEGNQLHYNGSTKTMRKLMGGDKLLFIMKGEATNTVTLEGAFQFFCKT